MISVIKYVSQNKRTKISSSVPTTSVLKVMTGPKHTGSRLPRRNFFFFFRAVSLQNDLFHRRRVPDFTRVRSAAADNRRRHTRENRTSGSRGDSDHSFNGSTSFSMRAARPNACCGLPKSRLCHEIDLIRKSQEMLEASQAKILHCLVY